MKLRIFVRVELLCDASSRKRSISSRRTVARNHAAESPDKSRTIGGNDSALRDMSRAAVDSIKLIENETVTRDWCGRANT